MIITIQQIENNIYYNNSAIIEKYGKLYKISSISNHPYLKEYCEYEKWLNENNKVMSKDTLKEYVYSLKELISYLKNNMLSETTNTSPTLQRFFT